MTIDELRQATADRQRFLSEPFAYLRAAADLHADPPGDATHQDTRQVIIQCLEHRDGLHPSTQVVVDALVRELGLFPYLRHDDTLDDGALLARETLRVDGIGQDGLVLHAAQAQVFARLMAGDNVILSAPTSFGKSLIIDALLASGRYDNVLVVVPTLALIDEIRRRLATRKTGHKVITHPTQPHGERNVFVLTQERVLETPDLPRIELFALDEFYKLAGTSERAQVLNQVFYEMRRDGAQYYLLGPNVDGLADEVPSALQDEFVRSDDTTVALRFHDVDTSNGREEALVQMCNELRRLLLIYCQSPDSAHRTARMLLNAGVGAPVASLDSAANWVAENYHPDWVVAHALRRGIGIHHGQLPRALAQFMVTAFEQRRINILLATGTLIEGVNTHARHVAIYDRQRPGPARMDSFTFRNISGRCGRMFHHFSGDVWLFWRRPPEDLPEVDIPVLSQTEATPTSLLQHVSEDDLTERARERLEPIHEQSELSEATLRANVGLDLQGQIGLAKALRANPRAWHPLLSFTSYPTSRQLQAVCKLLWEHLKSKPKNNLASWYTRTPKQLAYQLQNFGRKGSAKGLIHEAVAEFPDEDVDRVLKEVCGFVRNVAGFAFPVRLRALDRIQREVFTRAGLVPGDYSRYISRVESLFLDAPLVALDEYGVPPELAQKLRRYLKPDGDLDAVLLRLAAIRSGDIRLTSFEAEMLTYAQRGL